MDHQGAKGPIFLGRDKLLVYQRDNKTGYYPGYFDFPGGGKEKGETVFETFRREVKEEFDLDITLEQIKFVKRYPSTRFPGMLGYFVVALLPKEDIGKVNFGSEGIQYKVMGLNDYMSSPKGIPFLKERTQFFLNSVGL